VHTKSFTCSSNKNEIKFICDEAQEDMPLLVELMKENQMTKILDHGCGVGQNTVYLARQSLNVSGLDISDSRLSDAKKWLKDEKLHANLIKANFFKKLPYNNEWFDTVISIRAIGHNRKNSIKKAIDEIYRILKCNGYFYLQTAKMTTDIENYMPSKFRKLTNNTYLQLEGYQKGTIHYLFSESSIKEMFNNFRILYIRTDKTKRLYSILAQKP